MLYLTSPLMGLDEIRLENDQIRYLLLGISNMRKILEGHEGNYVVEALKYKSVKKPSPNWKK